MTTTLQNLTAIDGTELVSLAQRIRTWQQSRKLSDNELVRQLSGVGSTKTFTRILKNDLEELDLDRWLANYRAAWAVIESLSGRERNQEELYEDVSTIVAMRSALVDILECRSIRRVILLEADTGLGKSSSLTLLLKRYGQRILPIEAADAWNDNPNALLGAILDAKGVKEHAMTRDGRLRQAINKLKEARVTIAVDEAHHLGPHCLNTLKTIINQTSCEVALFALPALWRRLERSSYEEVKQLLGNRLAERIKIEGLRETDVRKILVRRLNVEDPKAAKVVLQEAATRGNLSFVAAVCERIESQELGAIATLEQVSAAVAHEKARR